VGPLTATTTATQHVQRINALATAAATVVGKVVPATAVHARVQEHTAEHHVLVKTVPIFASVIRAAMAAAQPQPVMMPLELLKTHLCRIWKHGDTFNAATNAQTGV
jgi:hypothetical protein